MTVRLNPYPDMKHSGVPWLGEVPEHWQVVPMCAIAQTKSITGKADRELLSVYLDRGVIRFAEVDEKRTNVTSEDLSKYQAVDYGDLVLNNQQAWRGSVGVSQNEGIVSPAYLVLSLDERLEPEYANLLFRSRIMVDQYLICSRGVGTIQRNLYWPSLKRVSAILPPHSEQAAIVRFLDHADRRIRRAIRAKQKLIKLLEEQKQAIIHRAVTRGLDHNVRLKPSGVEWLGDMPEHWDIRKLKFEMSFRGGGTPSKEEPSYWGGDIPWVSPKDMKCDVISDAEDHITERAVVESSTNLVPSGSILIVVRSGILQRTIPIATCNREVALNQDMTALNPIRNLTAEYFILLVRGCENVLLSEWTKRGATVESIEHQFLANSQIPIPPREEQSAIVGFISDETKGIGLAIERAKREIDFLKEYRTRLIADVVTGKLDVREAAAQLPDELDEPEEPETLDGVADALEVGNEEAGDAEFETVDEEDEA